MFTPNANSKIKVVENGTQEGSGRQECSA